jgi:hypothetical protein
MRLVAFLATASRGAASGNLLGAFAYLAVPTASRVRRGIIVGLFAVILGALFFGYSDMLGRPKSTRLEVFRTNMQDAKVIGSYFERERRHVSLAAIARLARAALL